jgi:hypothetical protein
MKSVLIPTLVTAIGTLVIELITLHVWVGVFTGGFLGDYMLLETGQRIGLVVVMSLYALGATSIFLPIAVLLLRLFRHLPAERAPWIACVLWLLALTVISVVKMRVGDFIGDAFDLDLIKGLGGGSYWGAAEFVLAWFWKEALVTTLILIALIVLAVKLTKLLRRSDLSDTRLGRLSRPVVRTAAILTVVFMLLNICLLGSYWPAVSWAAGRSSIGEATRFLVSKATDVDGDGFGAFDTPADQAPFDASFYPGAPDTPDDGVDSDGLLGDLRRADVRPEFLARAARHRSYPRLEVTTPRNVVLVFLESFRHDLLGSRANGREVTPFMSQLIASGEALNVDPAWATISFTRPSILHSFWGGYTRGAKTLYHDLHDDNGYWCGAASGQDETFGNIEEEADFVRYEFFEDSTVDGPQYVMGGQRPVNRVLLSIDRFLAARPKEQPFFLYVNFQDCHFPYNVRNPELIWEDLPVYTSLKRDNAEMLRRFFQHQAANVDRGIKELAERLRRQGVWDDTILVLVGDHGESIYEDGVLGHGLRLTDTQSRIACLFVHPTTNVPAPFVHRDLRHLLHGMLTVKEPVASPRVELDPERRVLQIVGEIYQPKQLGHVDASGRRVIYDFGRGQCLDQQSGLSCVLDSPEPAHVELSTRVKDLVRHWELERWIAAASPEEVDAWQRASDHRSQGSTR